MLFNSQIFVFGFLPLCLTGLVLFRRWALWWLIGMSFLFYGWWNVVHVPLLAASILANYAAGLRIARGGHARAWLIAGVSADLGLLGWFKYAGFLFGIEATEAPPLAISFFTFQQIMFLTDCWGDNGSKSAVMVRAGGPPTPYTGKHGEGVRAPPARTVTQWPLLHYAAFVSFFPHLIAGPLVRPRDIVPQLSNLEPDLSAGLTLFLLGLAKKLVLADLFGAFADIGFDAAAQGEVLTLLEAWAATLSYALQIYFDFSAYSDMATGLARMIGVRFPLNFDSPYKSRDIGEFWRRWHISLSRFLRDHVYIPLGGNRRGTMRLQVNLMATMLLGGLWHGAAWNFILWGGLHGFYLVVHHIFRQVGGRLPSVPAQALTVLAVIVAWVPFRADGLQATLAMLRGMAGLNGVALPAKIVAAAPAFLGFAEPVPVLRFLGDARNLSFPEVTLCLGLGWAIALGLPHVQELSARARSWALTASFALTVQALFFAPDVSPFLYFQF